MTDSAHRCILVRHGETEWSRDGRHTGRTDLPLLPEGEAQAAALRPSLDGFTFTTVLTSPLRRARETADLAGLGRHALVDPDLAEWDYGAYEGVTTAQIRQDRPGWDLFADGVPDGESAQDVAAPGGPGHRPGPGRGRGRGPGGPLPRAAGPGGPVDRAGSLRGPEPGPGPGGLLRAGLGARASRSCTHGTGTDRPRNQR